MSSAQRRRGLGSVRAGGELGGSRQAGQDVVSVIRLLGGFDLIEKPLIHDRITQRRQGIDELPGAMRIAAGHRSPP